MDDFLELSSYWISWRFKGESFLLTPRSVFHTHTEELAAATGAFTSQNTDQSGGVLALD